MSPKRSEADNHETLIPPLRNFDRDSTNHMFYRGSKFWCTPWWFHILCRDEHRCIDCFHKKVCLRVEGPFLKEIRKTKMAAPASDITGYRSDGGGLGQDQGISKNLRNILTAKLPLLSSPGTLLENTLYYDINSSSIVAVEQQATYAKDRITLNNFSMDASPSAYIPSVLFAGTVFWQAQLNLSAQYPSSVSGIADTSANNFCAPHGWGFAALNQIVVYMGASTIAQIQIGAMTNYLINAATCETSSKRRSMLDGAGKYLNNRDSRSLMAAPPALAKVGQPDNLLWRDKYYGDFYNTVLTTAYQDLSLCHITVPIRLPWSSMAALDKRLSMDTKLSTQPIQITLFGNGPSQFLNIGSALVGQNGIGTAWDSSTIQLWQEELSDKSLSVRNELLAMPEFNVGYPFQYAQSIPFDIVAAGDSGTTDYVFTMNITSIINSDLTTFLFNVTWDGHTNPANGQPCPLYGEKLQDITLLLNGQRFFAFDQDSYPFVTLAKQLDCPDQEELLMPSSNVNVTTSGTNQAFITTGHIYEFNNSRLRSIVSEANLQNTARFTNQTFQLQFKINRDEFYLGIPATSGSVSTSTYQYGVSKKAGYRLNMTYLYNAVFMIGGDGGTTKLITN